MASIPYEDAESLRPQPYDYRLDEDALADFSQLTPELGVDNSVNPYDTEIVLGQVRPVITEVIDNLGLGGSLESTASRKEFIKQEIPQLRPVDHLGFALVGLYEQSNDGSTLREFVGQVFAKHNIQGEDEVTDFAAAIKEVKDKFRLFTPKVTEALEQVVAADETGVAAYTTAKLLAAPPEKIVDDLGAVMAQDCAVIGAEFKTTDLYGELLQKVLEGEFDRHIAKDLLYASLHPAGEPSDGAPSSPLSKMLAMGKSLARTDDEHDVINRLSQDDMLPLWRKEAYRMLEGTRTELVESMKQRFSNRREYAYAIGVLPKPVTPAAIERALGKFRAIRKQNIREARRSSSPSLKRRYKRAVSVGGAAVTQAEAVSPEIESARKHTLYRINTRGEVFGDEAGEFGEMVEKYVATHPNVATKLKRTVTQALDYLREPVLTHGYPRGIDSYNDGYITFPGDSTKYKVYRLKPNRATGVPMSCEEAQKMRILYVVDKEDGRNLHIMGICDRDEVADLYAQFGGNNVVRN